MPRFQVEIQRITTTTVCAFVDITAPDPVSARKVVTRWIDEHSPAATYKEHPVTRALGWTGHPVVMRESVKYYDGRLYEGGPEVLPTPPPPEGLTADDV